MTTEKSRIDPALPSDRFVSPFPNDNAARAANGGALPPDLSLIIKARLDGANYVHGVLTGYKDAPAGKKIPEGMNYNAYFAGNLIAMPPPLSDEGVDYSDKTKATVAQQAEDVVTFLSWAAEPELEERKRMGVKVILFLLLLTGCSMSSNAVSGRMSTRPAHKFEYVKQAGL